MTQGRGILLVCLSILFAGSAWAQKKTAKIFPAVPGQFVVKMKNDMMTASAGSLANYLHAQTVQLITPESRAYLVTRPAVETADYSLQSLNQMAGVELVEPNYIYKIVGHATGAPNDPQFANLWGMNNTGQLTKGDPSEGTADVQGVPGVDIDAMKAWAITTGSRNVKIAVIDTGIDYNLPDLKDNIWNNTAEINGKPGVDDDANGCIDDFHGCNFAANTGDPMDDHGHGSHVSGTIAAEGNNGIGVVGVAWEATLVPVKFLDSQGSGSLANAIKAIDYATKVGVKIMSNSWGGGAFSQTLFDAINRAKAAGILFVAAAGNDGTDNDASPEYPASYNADNIISVAAVDAAGNLADFSCYGKTTVHIAAPGVNIISNVPAVASTTGFADWSGTSMATPHVSGVAALLMSQHPEQTYTQIKNRLLAGARPLASLRGKVISGGMVDAYYALTDQVAPNDPRDPYYWPRSADAISTAHPYANNDKQTWTVSVPGAAQISVHFSKFDTEATFDVLTITDKTGKVVAQMSGTKGDVYSPVINGDTATLSFTSDSSNAAYGFDIVDIAYQNAKNTIAAK